MARINFSIDPSYEDDPVKRQWWQELKNALGEVKRTIGTATEAGNDPGAVAISDHGLLDGLDDDDHTQYLRLVGRTGGQVIETPTAADFPLLTLRAPTTSDFVAFSVKTSANTEYLQVRSGGGSGRMILGVPGGSNAYFDFQSDVTTPVFATFQGAKLVFNSGGLGGLNINDSSNRPLLQLYTFGSPFNSAASATFALLGYTADVATAGRVVTGSAGSQPITVWGVSTKGMSLANMRLDTFSFPWSTDTGLVADVPTVLRVKNFGTVGAGTAATIPLVVEGAATQTGDMTRWQRGDHTVVTKVDKDGNITAPTVTATIALSGPVLESDIVNGTLLARVADNENIDGSWLFQRNGNADAALMVISSDASGVNDDEGLQIFNGAFRAKLCTSAALAANINLILPATSGQLVSNVESITLTNKRIHGPGATIRCETGTNGVLFSDGNSTTVGYKLDLSPLTTIRNLTFAVDANATVPVASAQPASGSLLRGAGATTAMAEVTVGSTGQALVVSGGQPTWGAYQAFPIGAVFISVVSTNPNTLLGYGTWSQIAGGRVLLGQTGGASAEDTGGSDTVASAGTVGAIAASASATTEVAGGVGTFVASELHTHPAPSFTGTATSVVQPYFVVYMWKRTA